MARISQELRAHFPETDLRRRDGQRKHASYMGEMDEDYEETMEEHEGFSAEDAFNEEGLILWNDITDEMHEAMAAIQGARRTLREARGRQHSLKLSRQYYKSAPGRSSGNRATGSAGATPDKRDEKMTCLNCGRVGHKAANCPDRDKAAHAAQEEAPFVCFVEEKFEDAWAVEMTEETIDAEAWAAEVTTAQAVEQGKCVIDPGATRTLGSVSAVEKIMQLKAAREGSTGILEVDNMNRPTFGFGNSSRDQCLSTIKLALQANGRPGSLQIHTLDRGTGPVLLSIDTLRQLGAVIDFTSDYMVLRNIDANRMIPLERSATGHQLLSLTQDLYSQSLPTKGPVPSLSEFLMPSNQE